MSEPKSDRAAGARYLHDYIFMAPPGSGTPERVPNDSELIGRRMFQGWEQVDPPAAITKEK